VSDLTAAQWRDIVNASIYLPGDGTRTTGRYIAVDKVREIIKKSRRSNDQNALLWALYTDALNQGGETLGGWTSEEIHLYMCGEFHGWECYTAFGMTRQRPVRRSSRLTKSEFADFIAFVVQRFAEHNIVLSLPGDELAKVS
jgi:hypothetical protein